MDGVELIPQTMAPFPWHFGGQRYQNIFVHAEEIVHWCKKLNLRMCFDISHSRLMCNHFGLDFYEFSEKIAPITGHLHLGDASGVNGEGLQIGEGDIDFARLLAILDQGAPMPRSYLRYGKGIKMAVKDSGSRWKNWKLTNE